MSKLTGYETYCRFIALKNHFTTDSYNYFKYNGKVNISTDTFLRNKDRFLYEKLARKYNEDQMTGLMVSNFIEDKVWIRDLLDDEGYDRYQEHEKVRQSLSYFYGNDIDRIFSSVEDPKDVFKVREGQNPLLLDALMRKEVTLETCCILDSLVEYTKRYDEEMKDDYIWSKIRLKLIKYTAFLNFDKRKFGKILKDRIETK
jgi:hypothetical protein